MIRECQRILKKFKTNPSSENLDNIDNKELKLNAQLKKLKGPLGETSPQK